MHRRRSIGSTRSCRRCSGWPPRRASCSAGAPVGAAQSAAALRSATERLGDRGAAGRARRPRDPDVVRHHRRCPASAGSPRRAAARARARSKRNSRAVRRATPVPWWSLSGALREGQRAALAAPRQALCRLRRRHRLGRIDACRARMEEFARRCGALGHRWRCRRRDRRARRIRPRPSGSPRPWPTAPNQTLLLADARGTVWNGSATAVLTGGRRQPRRCRAARPPALDAGLAALVRTRTAAGQPCCLHRPLAARAAARLRPFQRDPAAACRRERSAQWPAAWLSGLGTPWNTLQLGGELRLDSPGLTVERVQGRWRLTGAPTSSWSTFRRALSTIDPLGSYRVSLAGDPATPGAATSARHHRGRVAAHRQRHVGAGGLRFRGEASAQPGDEAALANLLNIIGRRSGARSVISIG